MKLKMTEKIKILLKGLLLLIFFTGLIVFAFGDLIKPNPLVDHTIVLTYQGGKDTIDVKYRNLTWYGNGNIYITGENASQRFLLAHNIVRYEVIK